MSLQPPRCQRGTNVKGEGITDFTGVTYKSSTNAVALLSTDGQYYFKYFLNNDFFNDRNQRFF
ncbi:hypothetical protein [Oceanobacillus kimchii]|uniref:hypothetical protein n=1 Tax=Oceanobacillus kimchii TaxID=746691 RepID=UPI0011157BD9|nr:hypothetical protein [Oceanobacillus kimchii]